MRTSLGGRESSHGHDDGNWRASTDLTHIPKPSAADFGPNNRKSKGVHPRVNMMRLNHRQKSDINWSRAIPSIRDIHSRQENRMSVVSIRQICQVRIGQRSVSVVQINAATVLLLKLPRETGRVEGIRQMGGILRRIAIRDAVIRSVEVADADGRSAIMHKLYHGLPDVAVSAPGHDLGVYKDNIIAALDEVENGLVVLPNLLEVLGSFTELVDEL